MRVRKSLYIIIITLLMTLSGPLQAVTASQLSEKDNKQETTMRLPNEGRSDLQELIQRVDANVGGSSAEEPSSESAIDEPETVEAPVAEITDNQKPVEKLKHQEQLQLIPTGLPLGRLILVQGCWFLGLVSYHNVLTII